MRHWYSIALALLASLSINTQQQPTFRSRVDLVTVDVNVVDTRGQPVRDLRPEDFIVSVEGSTRRVVAADYVGYALRGNRSCPRTIGGRPLRAGHGGDSRVLAPAWPRTILLVVDESNIRAGYARAAASAAATLLKYLDPSDRVGVLTIPHSSTRIEPTTDRDVVRQALDHIVGHLVPVETRLAQRRSLSPSDAFAMLYDKRAWRQALVNECMEGFANKQIDAPSDCVPEMENLARTMMADVRERMLTSARALTGVMEGIVQVQGPKTIILVSQELPVASALPERRDFDSETASIARLAAQAQATVYVLQLDRPLADVESRVRPSDSGADADMAAAGLETITALTGGRRLMVSGRAESAFDRIAREMSGFYVVGFEPDGRDRDGRPHNVTVKVRREGTEVRARRLFSFADNTQTALAHMTPTARATSAPARPLPAAPPPEPSAATAASPVPAPSSRGDAPAAPAQPSADGFSPAAPATDVDALVARASQWVAQYAEQMSLVIGVEHYAQYMGEEAFSRAYGRQLVSEFALVRVKGDWLGFRDVYEVDGKPVGDRQDRLKKLLLEAPDAAVTQGRKISDESARYNLGAIQRNFNVPTMALFFLQSTNVARFTFRKDGEEVIDGHRVWKVRYQEARKPTIIRTSSGKDMPLTGTYWIDATAGQVLRTHMEIATEATMSADQKARTGPTPPAGGPANTLAQKYGSIPWIPIPESCVA